MMEILNEKEETMVKMEVDMSTDEINGLVDYFDTNCPFNVKINQKVSWAMADILTKQMNKEKNER